MRPLKLTLRSFGPFAGEQTVDFTRYGDNAFLLINGPTGSGKTSILDGICYALYGEASGANRNEHYLRSQLAAPEALCEVEFLFSVGPRTFLVKRRPTQTFMQKGVPRETLHKVEFSQVDSTGIVTGDRLTKVGEVRDRIEEVIGFSSEQFRQVVVLPQGEFRRLLLAKSDEKERILEKLFATERYKLVEESLKRKRAAIGSELKELRSGVDGILAANGVATTQDLEERITDLLKRTVATEANLAAQRTLQTEVQQQFMAAQTLEACFLERDAATAEVTTLQQKVPEMELAAKRAERATRALNLADLEDAIKRAESERTSRKEVLTALIERIGTMTVQKQQAQESADTARQDNAKVAGLIAEKTRLEGQLVKLKELVTCRTKQKITDTRVATSKETVDALKVSVAAAEKRIAELSAEIESLSLTAGSVAQLQIEIAHLQNILSSRETYDAESARLKEIADSFAVSTKNIQTVETALAASKERQQQLQHDFIAGQSALLAAGLEDGSPCPVCGSDVHPHPAEGGADIPTEKQLAEANKQISEVEKQMHKASKEQNALLAQKSGLETGVTQRLESLGVAAKLAPAELLAQLTELKVKQATANAAITRLSAGQKEREQLTVKQTEMKNLLEKSELEYSTAKAEQEGIRALVAQALTDAGESNEKSVTTRISDIAAFVTLTAKLLEKSEQELAVLDGQLQTANGEQTQLNQQLLNLETNHSELTKSFGIRLDTEGFSGNKEYNEAKLPGTEIDRLKKAVDTFREQQASTAARHTRAVDACRDKERPDLVAVKAAKESVDAIVGNLQKEAGILTGQHSGLTDAMRTIGEKGTRITVLEQEYSVTARLADLVGGQNPHRMTLQRYVLAALFEEVAIAASQRLTRMSRGRYHLVRSETPRDGKATGGLDLDVTDDYIGEKRPAFTLSGGETFLASLSLALGLSDVVMAQQGGRYLDCIFIDEGFGSLDGETLDFALNTLIELHRAGRVIGIISHVAELKERIQSRIDVIASKDGSRIVQETA